MRLSTNRLRAFLVAALFAAFAVPAFTQETDMDNLAARVAEIIRQNGRSSAVLLNYFGGSESANLGLGQRLSADFFQALQHKASGFRLIDQKELEKTARKYSLEATCDAMSSLWVGQKTGAAVVVTSKLESVSGTAEYVVKIWDVIEDTREIGQLRLRLPPSKEVDEFLAQAALASSASHPEAMLGQPSPSAAVPDKKLTQESGAAKCRGGTVMLRILMSPEGRALKVVLEKGVGGGLDENAVAAVRDWKYPPPKGAREAIWVQLEVTFRLK